MDVINIMELPETFTTLYEPQTLLSTFPVWGKKHWKPGAGTQMNSKPSL